MPRALVRLRKHFPSKMVAAPASPGTFSRDADNVSNEHYEKIFGCFRERLRSGEEVYIIYTTWDHAHKFSPGEAPSMFPIGRLPIELLAEVMRWYIRRIYEQFKYDPIRGLTPYAWLSIRHVCRVWRDLALRTPELSTFICLTRLECVQEMLDLSRDLPIHIYERPCGTQGLEEREVSAILQLVLTNFSRISTAVLRDWNNNTSLLSFDNPLPPNTIIRSLTWHSMIPYSPFGGPITFSSQPILPNFIFANLQYLNCAWTSTHSISHMLHPGLLHLELYEPCLVSDHLLAALANMHLLESLILRRVHTRTSNSANKVVTLSHLRNLVLSYDGSTEDLYLLRCIMYPAGTSVILQAHTYGQESSSVYPALAILTSKLQGVGVLGRPDELHSIAINIFGDEIRLSLWTQPQPLEIMQRLPYYGTPSPVLPLAVTFHSQEDWIIHFLESIPIQNVRAAHLAESYNSAGSMLLARLASVMPHLETLSLKYDIHSHENEQRNVADAPIDALADKDLGSLFSELKFLHVYENCFDPCRLQPPPVSDLRLTAYRIMSLKNRPGSPFKELCIRKKSASLSDWTLGTAADCRCLSCTSQRIASAAPPAESTSNLRAFCCRFPRISLAKFRTTRVGRLLGLESTRT